MLYLRCPTCKTVLANKQLLHEEMMAKICNDSKMSEVDKDKAKMKLLDDLEVIRMCCRMRVMSYVKLIELIK